jgi:hypothetical protein
MEVGTLTLAGSTATLDDEGGWKSEDESFAALLNNQFPADSGSATGDHHLPFGIPAGLLAADMLGGEWKAAAVNEELPEGAVS